MADPNQRDNRHRSPTSRWSSSTQDSRLQARRKRRTHYPNIVSCIVDTFGKNKFGEVSSASLLVDGYVKESSIWLEPMAIPNSAVPPSFEVEVEMKMEHADEGPRDFSYRIVDGRFVPVPAFRETPSPMSVLWVMPFFADYVFSSESGDGTFNLGKGFLLRISPNICLVLEKTCLRLSRDIFIIRRVGILKVPHDLDFRYGIDVMRGSQRTTVAIV